MVAFLAINPWTIAAVTVIVIAVAGASGAFDQTEIDDDDYDDNGIFVPELPTPTVHPEVNPNPNETPNEYDYTYPDVKPDATKEQDKFLFPLPYGFVNVYMTEQAGDDFDPDFDIPDDVRPPSSSFTVGAEAYDSGIGYIIAAIMAGILVFWLISMCSGNIREAERCR